jgi:hypothetical protein
MPPWKRLSEMKSPHVVRAVTVLEPTGIEPVTSSLQTDSDDDEGFWD